MRRMFFPALIIWFCVTMTLDVLSHSWPELKGIVGFIALVGGLFFWFGSDVIFLDFPKNWEDTDSSETPNRLTKPPRPEPPLGYRGPFWNKPTRAYLQANVRSFSGVQRWVVVLLMLVPFGALAYFLFH